MKQIFTKSVSVAASLLLAASSASADRAFGCWPAAPGGILPDNLPSVTGVNNMPSKHLRVAKLGNSKWDNTDGHDLREVQTEGSIRVLVLLVNFNDYKFSVSSDPRLTIEEMLQKPGFDFDGATGSALDYFSDISNGRFTPQFDVYGPIQLDHDEVYYVNSETGETYVDPGSGQTVSVYPAGYMVEEACRKIDAEVDFSQYDANNDGMVDFVYIFHAGRGATDSGNLNMKNLIWPHAFTLNAALGRTIEHDGVGINRYATSAEYNSKNKLLGMGMFVHEFSHVLGLPDLYDTANNNGQVGQVFSPGSFDCMDAGNYNNEIHTPPVYSSYERYAMEWMKPVEITGSASVTMLPLTAAEQAYKVSSPTNPQEYFLFEARAPYSWDKYIECHGLAVWHIDYNEAAWLENRPNNNASHQRVDLIEADDAPKVGSRNGDLFPGTENVCEFVPDMSPSFLTWGNKSTGYGIERIMRYPEGSVAMEIYSESGKEMKEMKLAQPRKLAVEKLSGKSALISWAPVDGAKDYRVCVWPVDGFDGAYVYNFVDGYYFTSTSGDTSLEISGLTPGAVYTAVVYACNDYNASRAEAPLTFTAADAAKGIVATATNGNKDAHLMWSELEGADTYTVTVATRVAVAGDQEFGCDFEGKKMPEGWSGTGRYEDRARYCGEAAPAYAFEGSGAWLETATYNDDIAELSFWARKRFSDDHSYIDVYAKDANGVMTYTGRLEGFDDEDGAIIKVVPPAGTRSLRLVYTMRATGLFLNIDDMKVVLAKGWTDTPVEGYPCNVADTDLWIQGLANGVEYVAYVEAKGVRSNDVTLNPDAMLTGMESVIADPDNSLAAVIAIEGGVLVPALDDMSYNVYSLDGRMLASGVKGKWQLPARGIYVVTSGATSAKLAW